MEYRQLGASGLRVPVLSFGTATFGGVGEFFNAIGATQLQEAKSLIDICLEAGINFFDTANNYSNGLAEEVLGAAVKGRRDKVLISTKVTNPVGPGPNDVGSSRYALLRACEDSLRRLDSDHIDLLYMHAFDATTPVDETLSTLDQLIRSGKVRYVGCSNFSGWHLMKSLSVSERYGWCRYVAHQTHYSLAARDFEWELMPLALDQKVGTVVWSPLSAGALSGKLGRKKLAPSDSRLSKLDFFVVRSGRLYDVIDTLEQIAAETDRPVSQIALNWVLQRPSVVSLVIGARNEEQLRQNLGVLDWKLSEEQMRRLDNASETVPSYPYWHQRFSAPINPPPVSGELTFLPDVLKEKTESQ